MALTNERALALKTALYKDAIKGKYVVPGFRVYKKMPSGDIVAVPGVGKQCRAMIRVYQEQHKLVVDGTFNTQTQNSLIPPPKITPGQRIANKAHAGLDLAPCHYTQARPAVTTLEGMKAHGCDCSAFAMICLSAAVSGYSTGIGNTWSLIAKGTHVSYAAKLPGDLVFYGPTHGDPEHVTVYVGDGYVISQGHEGGPYLEAIDYRDDRIDIRRYA